MSLSSSASNTSSPAAIWYTRCPVPTPLGIAVQLGFFHDEFSPDGLELRSLQETRNPAEQASHFDHSLPYSFRQGGNIPPIWARSKGRDTRVIGLSWTDEFQGVIALPKKGLKSARDLRGLRVGLPKRDIAIDFTRAAALKGVLTALELEGMGTRRSNLSTFLISLLKTTWVHWVTSHGRQCVSTPTRSGRWCVARWTPSS